MIMNDIDLLLCEISKQCLKSHNEMEKVRCAYRGNIPAARNKLYGIIELCERTLIALRNVAILLPSKEPDVINGCSPEKMTPRAEIQMTDYGYVVKLPLLIMDGRAPRVHTGSYIHQTVLCAIRDYVKKNGCVTERIKRAIIDVIQVYGPDIRPSELPDNDNIELRQTINSLKGTFLYGDDPINTKLAISCVPGDHSMTIIKLINMDKTGAEKVVFVT